MERREATTDRNSATEQSERPKRDRLIARIENETPLVLKNRSPYRSGFFIKQKKIKSVPLPLHEVDLFFI